ncbi:MAG: hypothetical protein ACMXX8_03140, partial [Candidatus Woesearchaeota archaeon]
MIKMVKEKEELPLEEKELDETEKIPVEEPTEVDVIEEVPEEDKVEHHLKDKKEKVIDHVWEPKTDLGKDVKNGKITDIDQILDSGKKILEPEIVDYLMPDLETDLLLIGQSKGKFGGGQRRVFRQTQKKTREGNKPQFATIAIVGDKNGHIGIGYGKSRETVPAREKAIRRAKLNIFKIRRGSGS